MLILTRKETEGIMIGDDIRIVVDSIRGGRVRIGIEAPKTAVILREEIKDKPQKEG